MKHTILTFLVTIMFSFTVQANEIYREYLISCVPTNDINIAGVKSVTVQINRTLYSHSNLSWYDYSVNITFQSNEQVSFGRMNDILGVTPVWGDGTDPYYQLHFRSQKETGEFPKTLIIHERPNTESHDSFLFLKKDHYCNPIYLSCYGDFSFMD